MTTSPTSATTPRRTLAQRIDRFLGGLERVRRRPNRRESYHVRDALEHLQTGQYGEGEVAIQKAEHAAALPAQVANRLETNEPMTTEQLRAQLDQIMQAGA